MGQLVLFGNGSFTEWEARWKILKPINKEGDRD